MPWKVERPGQPGGQHDGKRLHRLDGAGHEDGQDEGGGIHGTSSVAVRDGTGLIAGLIMGLISTG